MKLTENGKVLLEKNEIEMVIRHFKKIESFLKQFHNIQSKKRMPEELQTQWKKLVAFLEKEELPGSFEKEGKVDGRYCCKLTNRQGAIMNCRDYNAWYVFAWAACVGEALLAGWNGTLVSGRCRRVSGCPQCR